MCKAKPGPRCSGHVKEELSKLQEELKTIQSSEKSTLEEESEALKAYMDKLQEYYETPEGIKSLRENGHSNQAEESQRVYDEKMMAYRRVQAKRAMPENVQAWLNSDDTREFLVKVNNTDHQWLRDFRDASEQAGEPVFPHDPRVKDRTPLSVGFDIDEVLYPWTSHFRTYIINKEGHTEEECPPLTRYDGFVGEWKFRSREEFVEAMHRAEHEGVNHAGPPKPHAVDSARRILKDGHEVHIVTARAEHDGRTFTETKKWLAEHDIDYTSFSISFDKTSVPTDLFIDDKPGNCDDLKSAGTLPIMMGVDFNENDKNHLKVKDLSVWGDIVDSFSRWKVNR